MARLISIFFVLLIAAGIFFWAKYKKVSLSQEPQAISHSASINLDEWHEYSAPHDQFKVFFPGLPHYATESRTDPKSSEIRNYQVFVADKDNGTIYSITLISFPQKTPGALSDDFLQSYFNDELSTNSKNTMKDLKLINWKNVKAVDFNLENAGATVLGKGFIDGNTLYVLTVTSQPETLDPQEFNFFINSFQLMKPAAPQKNTR